MSLIIWTIWSRPFGGNVFRSVSQLPCIVTWTLVCNSRLEPFQSSEHGRYKSVMRYITEHCSALQGRYQRHRRRFRRERFI